MRAADYLEMVRTQREKVGRRRKWMWEGGGGRVKKLPCGHSSFHPIRSWGQPVWETECCVGNCHQHAEMVFSHIPPQNKEMARIKWPIILSSMPWPLTVRFFFIQQVLNITTSDLRKGCAVKTMKRASQLLTNGTHLHKRSRGDSWPFGLFLHPQTNT